MKGFAGIPSGTSPVLLKPLYPFMSVSSPSLIYPAHSAMSGFPQSALSSKTPFMFDSNFTFSFTTFHFLMRCIFVGQYRLLSVQFCKMSPGFILETGGTTTWFAVRA